MKSKLFQELHARDCQETEELQRNCRKQAERVGQLRIHEFSLPQKENLLNHESAFVANSGTTRQGAFLERRKRNLWSWDSEFLCTFAVNSRDFRVREEWLAAILDSAQHTELDRYFRMRFVRSASFDGPSLFKNACNGTSSHCEMRSCNSESAMRHGRRVRYAISGLHYGNFPGSGDFQCWRVNVKTEARVSTPFPQLAMSWIGDVRWEKMDDLLDVTINSRAKRCPWFWNAWCEDCVCVEKDHHQYLFQKESQCGRLAQKQNRFLRGG